MHHKRVGPNASFRPSQILSGLSHLRYGTVTAAILCLLGSSTAFGAEDELDENAPPRVPVSIFKKLYPEAKVKKHPVLLGISQAWSDFAEAPTLKRMTFIQTRIRGGLGLIPVESSRLTPLTTRLAAVAFPIYICRTCGNDVSAKLYSPRTWDSAEIERNNQEWGIKLLQIGFVDRVTNEFLGKPKNYPLESSHWDTLERATAMLNLEASVHPLAGCATCIEIRFTGGTSKVPDHVQVLAMTPSGIVSSDDFTYEQPVADTGKLEEYHYREIMRVGQEIVASKIRARTGQTETVVLLRLPSDEAEDTPAWKYHAD